MHFRCPGEAGRLPVNPEQGKTSAPCPLSRTARMQSPRRPPTWDEAEPLAAATRRPRPLCRPRSRCSPPERLIRLVASKPVCLHLPACVCQIIMSELQQFSNS